MDNTFLTAEWRKLLMLNYQADPKVLLRYLPAGTEFDLWNNTCYISLIGFMFLNTRVMGYKIPFHIHFEEVNLRFYVRRREAGEWRRGVVFIKEIVPKPLLSLVANTIYGEAYETMPMRHQWQQEAERLRVTYEWKKDRQWHSIFAETDSKPYEMPAGSEEEFITEHFWGYTKLGQDKTAAYEVVHPGWLLYKTLHFTVNVDFGKVYGNEFSFLDRAAPLSVFLAEGSAISVKKGRRI